MGEKIKINGESNPSLHALNENGSAKQIPTSLRNFGYMFTRLFQIRVQPTYSFVSPDKNANIIRDTADTTN